MDPGESSAVLVEVRQRKPRTQPLVILLQAAIAHLGKSEHALEDAERPLHPGAYAGLGPVPALLLFMDFSLALHPARGHVLRSGTPDLLLIAVEYIRQHV